MKDRIRLVGQVPAVGRRTPEMMTLVLALAMVAGGTADRLLADPPSPFATEVVEYVPGTGIPVDFISGDPFNDPNTALGPPTVDTTGDDWFIPLDEQAPVVPVYPAFRAFEIVTIGYGGHLTLKFDHPVVNDPQNPYGLDFIIFGNASQSVGEGQSWTNRNPNDVTIGSAAVSAELGLVSVSQDGLNWCTYTDGPYADDFAPTFGRRYDPNNPDPALGEWNEWWGGPTDPTLPLDPNLSSDTFVGKTVAEVAQLYAGSAGGTGFDIGVLGLDWIQYVRIENADLGDTPEIDAVADVASWRIGPLPATTVEPVEEEAHLWAEPRSP